ncbi:hypothetical protein AU193_16240 [Mycobacterium sp. GA-1285]|uniref:hypothetical protein n=1 Tax=Mycobacterium sp. GA-1285 TaxID=1772282 RepID=UPI000747FFD5|nr:hypothetical protein [Mycobacterium sp. GA-1285]KUI18781.1 hypothetical protein AU193_16240 [Mycobacterium sp. GA-1285]
MNPRLAATAGVVSVVLLATGPGAALAQARPGDSRGSDRGHSADRGGNHDSGDAKRATGSKRAGGIDGPGTGPESRVGSGRDDLAKPPSSNRPAVTAATPAVEVPVNAASASDPVASGGSGAASAPAPAFEPPHVMFGNGREPESRNPEAETGWQPPPLAFEASEQPLSPPPLSPAPPVPATLDWEATPSAVVRQFVVAPGAGTSDPMWGLAGLLLIPVAGAALGYRQARAAQAVERIGRP